ncbi:MAG: VWA domain-containing protein [Phycisphaerales bacterium]|nr:VWA domain-containing protein [Phycisphaerales bacterium]
METLMPNPSDWIFGSSVWLYALWGLPVLALIWCLGARLARIQLNRFADSNLQHSLVGRRIHWYSWSRSVLLLITLATIIIGIARPQSDPHDVEVELKGRDVVFLLDVSRSMLANDVAPNRLERAKLWINDLVDELQSDRVGLVAFAGSSTVVSPLTTDKLFFKLALDELDTTAVPVGGTNIGDAIRRTMSMVFTGTDESEFAHRDIVLITDGEDQESLPVRAAQAAGEKGVRIIAIGIGSKEGSNVPADPKNPDRRNAQVQSRLQSASLTQIAAATPNGVYLEVGTGTIDLAKVYRDLIAAADQRTIETSHTVQYTERFQFLLWIAFGAFMLEAIVLPTRQRRKPCTTISAS